jgi:predicted ATPase
VFVPQWLGLIAEIYGQMNQPEAGLEVLSDAFDVVEAREHRMWEAELHRIKGELLLMQGVAASEVEACYDKALEVARRQEAKSFELRAAMSLSRLWQQQGKREQAHALLGEVYSWFTEGFDTRDLQEAKALLERLA